MSPNENRPAANEAISENNNHPQDTAAHGAVKEPSAWLRGRIHDAVRAWQDAGSPARIVATLGDSPDDCCRCGDPSRRPLLVTASTPTGQLLVCGMLCQACHDLEAVTL